MEEDYSLENINSNWVNTNVSKPYLVHYGSLALTGSSGIVSTLSAVLLLILLRDRSITRLPPTSMLLLRYLTVADLMTAAGNTVGVTRYLIKFYVLKQSNDLRDFCQADFVCTAQSVVTTFSCMCSFLWTLMIGIFFVIKVIQHDEVRQKVFDDSTRYFHSICWGIPAVIILMALSMGGLGEDKSETTTGWCWIKDAKCPEWHTRQRIALMLWTGKLWEIIVYVTMVAISIQIKMTIYRMKKLNLHKFTRRNIEIQESLETFNEASHISKEEALFFLMPWFLATVRMPGTIRFFINLYTITSSNPVEINDRFLLYLQGLGDSTQAFWNLLLVIVYCPNARRYLRYCGRSQRINNNHVRF